MEGKIDLIKGVTPDLSESVKDSEEKKIVGGQFVSEALNDDEKINRDCRLIPET